MISVTSLSLRSPSTSLITIYRFISCEICCIIRLIVLVFAFECWRMRIIKYLLHLRPVAIPTVYMPKGASSSFSNLNCMNV